MSDIEEDVCDECNGDEVVDCDTCGGDGEVSDGEECPECYGNGEVECSWC